MALPEAPPATPSPPAPARSGPQRRPGAGALLILVPVALLAALGWQLRWSNEDGFIYYRVVDNLLAGHGPVFNVGERVESYTSPAWTGLLAATQGVLRPAHMEDLAMVLGVLLSAGGLWLGARGALVLLRRRGTAGLPLPLGALVIAVLPPFWDFSTSGLETGLVFGWMGLSFWALVAAEGGRDPSAGELPRRPRAGALAAAALFGLGPLVRPDLAIFSAALLVALLLVERPARRRRLAALVLAAAVVPVAYQVFRMGYFATLLPNTALAKEAGLPYWTRGLAYLWNFIWPYALVLPVAALVWPWARRWRSDLRAGPYRRLGIVAGAPALAALVHLVYVVRLGGDYMHGRMFLPTLFGLMLPVAVVPVTRAARVWAPAAFVVGWALVTGFVLRAPAQPSPGRETEVLDQRRKQLTTPAHPHPVRLADHAVLPFPQPTIGTQLKAIAARGPAVVVDYRFEQRRVEGRAIPTRVPLPMRGVRPSAAAAAPVAAYTGSIGRVGYAAGSEVRIGDRLGLADPIAARIRLAARRRAKAGHEKDLRVEWFLARFADPADLARDPRWRGDARVTAARAAVRCGPLADVLAGTSGPLSAERFADNIGVAISTRSLRVAKDPLQARAELCR